MGRFPFFKEIEGLPILIVGGGRIALHKAAVLAEFHPALKAVSPEFLPGFQDLDVDCIQRRFADSDLDGMFAAVAATDDPVLNTRIGALCTKKGIDVNVVDDAKGSTFQFPAMVQKGGMTVAVSSGGASPIASRYIRDHIENAIPDNFEDILCAMTFAKDWLKDRIPQNQPARAKVLRTLFDRLIEMKTVPGEDEIRRLADEIIFCSG